MHLYLNYRHLETNILILNQLYIITNIVILLIKDYILFQDNFINVFLIAASTLIGLPMMESGS